MTGGQFFAAFRLVSHVRAGREMDPALVFVQGKSPTPLRCFFSTPEACSTSTLCAIYHFRFDDLHAYGEVSHVKCLRRACIA